MLGWTDNMVGSAGHPWSEWPVDLTRCSCPKHLSPDTARSAASAVAVRMMWQATCGRFPGLGEVAARRFGPAAVELDLAGVFAYPVVSIDAVVQVNPAGDPTVWPEECWRFDPPHTLITVDNGDGRVVFPRQARSAGTYLPGSWWIEATIGAEPPAEVLAATDLLACELLKTWADPKTSGLPDGVTSISRQGTVVQFDRAQWAGVPLVAQVTKPWPEGWGCSPVEIVAGCDPAALVSWVDVTRVVLPEGS